MGAPPGRVVVARVVLIQSLRYLIPATRAQERDCTPRPKPARSVRLTVPPTEDESGVLILTVGKLMTDATLFNRLNSVTERFDQLVTKLNAGEGTAGQLLKDKQLYENMNKVTSELSALIEQITKNPKKYLNVKVSIF